MKEITI